MNIYDFIGTTNPYVEIIYIYVIYGFDEWKVWNDPNKKLKM